MKGNAVLRTPSSLIGAVLVSLVLVNRGLFAQASTFLVSSGQPWIDVTAQGAHLDAQTTCTASISGSGSPFTVDASGGAFDTAFLGEEVWMQVGATGASVAVGTITGIPTVVPAGSEVYVTTPSGAPTPTTGSNLCVTWGHDDVYALQASLNLLAAAPFNAIGGEIKIPHGRTGEMMIGQQVATLTGGSSGYAGVSTVTVAPGQIFGSAVGATVTIQNCMLTGGTHSFNGTFLVTGWNSATGELSYNQNPRAANTDTCAGTTATPATVTETGVYAPTQQAYVIEAENKTGAGAAAASGVQLLGGFTHGFILNIGSRGMDLNPAPRVQGLQFEDVSGTGASPGGLLCTQCLNGEFAGLSFTNFDGVDQSLGSSINRLSAGLTLSSSLTGGDLITGNFGSQPTQLSQPDTEINSIYDIRCANNAVCVDAGSTIGSDQDGPHIFGGYIQVSNTANAPSGASGTMPNTQSCTGIWAAGPLRYYGGLVDVGVQTPTSGTGGENCLGIWSTGGAASISGKFEQHGSSTGCGSPNNNCSGTGVYINPGLGAQLMGTTQSTAFQRDPTGSFVTVTLPSSVSVPFSQGQPIEISNVPSEMSTYPNCTFNTENGTDGGKAVVASVPTTHTFTYLQSCAADANTSINAVSATTIQGANESSDFVEGPMYNFYVPVLIGSYGATSPTGPTNNTIEITPGATTNTLGPGSPPQPQDVFDSGSGTVFTVNGSSGGQVVSEISAATPTSADLFDICPGSMTPTTCSSPGSFFKVDSAGSTWIGPNIGAPGVLNMNNGSGSGNYVALQAPTMLTSGAYSFILPPSIGSMGEPLLSGGTSSSLSFGTLGVGFGGTGLANPTQYAVLVGNGSGNVTVVGPGATGTVLTGQSSGNPIFSSTPSITLTNATGLPLGSGVTGQLPVGNGGTGQSTLTQHSVLVGNAGGNVTQVGPGGVGTVLTGQGSTTDPSFSSTPSITLTNATGLPLSTGVTGTLPTSNGGTNSSEGAVSQITCGASGVTVSTTVIYFGCGGINSTSITESNVYSPVPFNGVVEAIHVISRSTPASGSAITFHVHYNGSNLTSDVTCTLTNPAVACDGTGGTTTISEAANSSGAAHNYISVSALAAGTGNSANVFSIVIKMTGVN